MSDYETYADDSARTSRLLTCLYKAYGARSAEVGRDPYAQVHTDPPLTPFEAVVLEGCAAPIGDTYPPADHTYPRRDR